VTKKQFEPVVDRIRALAPLWQERMGLAHFEIEHVFLDSLDGEPGDGSDFHTTAVCEVRWQYLEAKIKWYLPSAVRHDPERLEETLVHELCHVLLAPEQSLLDVKLDQLARDESGSDTEALIDQFFERLELSTEMVARALFRVWGPAPS
jgi:hypothetical protein